MEEVNSLVQRALKADKIYPRPHGSSGVWISFLLPAAVIVGCIRTPHVSELYLYCAVYAFNTLLNALHLLFHMFKYKSVNVTKSMNLLCAVPATVTIFLYTQVLQLDLKKSLCYAVANALIYFEGIPLALKAFPKTFTFGEANVFIQGLSLFMYSLVLRLNNIMVNGAPKTEYDTSTVILQLALSWVLVFCIMPYIHTSLRSVVPFYLWGFITLGMIYFSVYGVLNCDLFLWLWMFLTKPERIGIIVLWLICSAIAVVIVQHQINKRKKSNTIFRKYFHALAVVVFLSGTFLDVNLIYFSSGCVFGLFVVLEAFRILELPPLYEFLRDGFLVYSDEKDTGVLAITPICLLVGSALPLWLHPLKEYSSEKQLQLLSGVLSVGVGDTFASVGGKLFGKHRWKGSSKTIEGTIFCILSQVLFIQVLVSIGLLQNSSKLIVKELIYRGNILENNVTLDSYGIHSGVTIHVLRKKTKEASKQVNSINEADILYLVSAFKNATKNPNYRSALQRLSRPEVLENIIAATPGLADDPIAVSIIQDPELLTELCDTNTVRKVVEAHPALAEAANCIVAVVHEEAASPAVMTNPGTSSGYSYSLDALSDDEEVDSSQSSDSQPRHGSGESVFASPITTAQLAAALATTSHSTGSEASGSIITTEMFNQAMQQAYAGMSPSLQGTDAARAGSAMPNLGDLEATSRQLARQLQQMHELGLRDDAINLQALQATDWNVQEAINLVFNGAIGDTDLDDE